MPLKLAPKPKGPPIRNAKRDKQIRRLRKQRYTLPDLARYFGISLTRVIQICEGVYPQGLTREYKNTKKGS